MSDTVLLAIGITIYNKKVYIEIYLEYIRHENGAKTVPNNVELKKQV